ncbi:BID domain-containing T4SS effector [Bartonella sp. CB189]|uniref:BID domain-containing T4SS effector n=1 Tax=Bartonella sp. CB189 TaxID=3112254 RepID=UPI002F9687CC
MAKLKRTKGYVSHAFNYVYPNGVLKNKHDIRNAKEFEEIYSRDVAKAIINLSEEPLPKEFDGDYLRHLHFQLFRNTFDWAGKTREIPTTLSDGTTVVMTVMDPTETGVHFASGTQIPQGLKTLGQILKDKDNLQGLSREDFVSEVVEVFNHINKVHPFRKGNGQTQRLFFTKLAEAAGHNIDFSLVTKARMNIACNLAAKYGDLGPMKSMFEDISNPKKALLLNEFISGLSREKNGDIKNDLILAANDGSTYTGIYQGCGVNSFAVKMDNTYIVGSIDQLKPEQYKSLKIGDKITFTVPKSKNIEEVLIPAEKLSPLRKEELFKMVSKNDAVQKARKEVQDLAKLVYGKPNILNKELDAINRVPGVGEKLPLQISRAPRTIGSLAGFSLCGLKTVGRQICEENIWALSDKMSEYISIVRGVKKDILENHESEQLRRGQAVKMPNKLLQSLMSISSELRQETLRESASLRKEFDNFMSQINKRLSEEERRAVDHKSYGELARNVGISVNKAEQIVGMIKKVETICHEQHLQVMEMQRAAARACHQKTMSMVN